MDCTDSAQTDDQPLHALTTVVRALYLVWTIVAYVLPAVRSSRTEQTVQDPMQRSASCRRKSIGTASVSVSRLRLILRAITRNEAVRTNLPLTGRLEHEGETGEELVEATADEVGAPQIWAQVQLDKQPTTHRSGSRFGGVACTVWNRDAGTHMSQCAQALDGCIKQRPSKQLRVRHEP